MAFPKTIALISELDLGHPVLEVSPHGISKLGYLKRQHSGYDSDIEFMPWPVGADGHKIFTSYLSELADFEMELTTAVNEQRIASWIEELSAYCATISREHGFHERADALIAAAKPRKGVLLDAEGGTYDDNAIVTDGDAVDALTDYINTRLLLIVSEAVEAMEELRSGRTIDEVWYNPEKPGKPEGFLSELIDVGVRFFDLIGELNLAREGAEMFVEKTKYNASRPYKHGRKF